MSEANLSTETRFLEEFLIRHLRLVLRAEHALLQLSHGGVRGREEACVLRLLYLLSGRIHEAETERSSIGEEKVEYTALVKLRSFESRIDSDERIASERLQVLRDGLRAEEAFVRSANLSLHNVREIPRFNEPLRCFCPSTLRHSARTQCSAHSIGDRVIESLDATCLLRRVRHRRCEADADVASELRQITKELRSLIRQYLARVLSQRGEQLTEDGDHLASCLTLALESDDPGEITRFVLHGEQVARTTERSFGERSHEIRVNALQRMLRSETRIDGLSERRTLRLRFQAGDALRQNGRRASSLEPFDHIVRECVCNSFLSSVSHFLVNELVLGS